jgi:Cu/Ag efflux protein CusF
MAAASIALGAALALAAGASLAPAPALAQAGAAADASAMASGEVRRVDAAGGKLTIRHGEIPNLEMPPMTMVFRVRDAAMLQGLQQGDKIRFAAEKDGSQYVVVRLTRE